MNSPDQLIPSLEIRQYIEQRFAVDAAHIDQTKTAWEKRQQQLQRPNNYEQLKTHTSHLEKLNQEIKSYRIDNKQTTIHRFYRMVEEMQKSQNPFELAIVTDIVEMWNIIRKKDISTKDITLMIDYVLDKLNTDTIEQYIAYMTNLNVDK